MKVMKIVWSFTEPEKHNIWMRPLLDKEGVDFLYFNFDKGDWVKVALVVPQEEESCNCKCQCQKPKKECDCETKKE